MNMGIVDVEDVTLENVGGVPVADATPVSTKLAGVEEGLVEQIDNMDNLTKAELIALNKQLSETVKELSEQVAHFPAEKDKLVNDINEHYQMVLSQKNKAINYFIKKLNLISDLINMEKED